MSKRKADGAAVAGAAVVSSAGSAKRARAADGAEDGADAPATASFLNEMKEHEDASEAASWHRAPVGAHDPASDALAFQWYDIDMYGGPPLRGDPGGRDRPVPGATAGTVPVIRLYGVTRDGHSAVAHVHGVTPYFYCNAPPGFAEADVRVFQAALEQQLQQSSREGGRTPRVLSVRVVRKQSLLGYHGGTMTDFLLIYVAMPTLVPTARGILERGFNYGSGLRTYQCYEANVPFVLRFMIDRDIGGCNWVELPAGTYSLRAPEQRQSLCQLEADIVYSDLLSHAPDGPWLAVAPIRILSFDIECMGRRGCFPEPDKDPVIQIANIVQVQGSAKSSVRNVFVLDTCKPIVGAGVHSFRTERELLLAWARFVREVDPDVITGYNVQNFDVPYLLNRAKALGIEGEFATWGRIKDSRTTMKESTFQSAQYGKRSNVITTITGRVTFDMMQFMVRNYKLSSFSLNSVSAHFLGQQKEDVHHSIIADLQQGTDEDRRRLAVYCLKDAYLPLRLMEKLMALINYVEMARVTGVPLEFLLERGQQIKVLSMLYRKAMQYHLIVPTVPRAGGAEDTSYEGATVIDPLKAYYDEPIATLDFASLYPSIMMAHNLCYTTLVAPDDVSRLKEEQVTKTPSGDTFVRQDVQKGVLPLILEELLAARKRAKRDMEAATDPMVRAVQNGRQLALKISANSVYGFTGATVGQLPCLAISASVTAFGREMIQQTKAAVETKYRISNGYPADAVVVYGDTDSVMVKFGVRTVEEAMGLGREAAVEMTKLFPPPVKLEFEKVYFPFLLMNKKRYAGLYWTRPDRHDKLDAKGIETVRRDNCLLVRKVVGTCLQKILVDRDIEGAINYAKAIISDLLQNKLDISLLVITKALGKGADAEDYAAKQAHVELAMRMRKRDPGSAPVVGDRVPYVIIQGAKGAPAYEKSEDPIYVLENNLPIDTQYYLDRQLAKPLERIFGPIIDNPQSLLHGDHTRTIAKPTPANNKGIMMFAVRTLKCLGCKAPLSGGRTTVCAHCEGREGDIFVKSVCEVNELEERFARLWTQCQRCQGSLHQDVLCTSRVCPIFYMRKKVQKDLKDAHNVVDRFEEQW